MPLFLQFLLVGSGAALGGMLRQAINLAGMKLNSDWPWHTFAINILGSFVMGLIVGWLAARGDGNPAWRLFLATGICGGFTTFSAYSLEIMLLFQRGQTGQAILYALASVLIGVAALGLGLAATRGIFLTA